MWKLEKVVLEKSRIISPRVSKVCYRIKNLSKNTTLSVTENGTVIEQPSITEQPSATEQPSVTEQPSDEDEKGQLWEKEPINEGYFTLTSFCGEGKLLTTASDGHLETTGMYQFNVIY